MSLKIKGLYLRGNAYWYRHTVNGSQVRMPLKASNLSEAAACIKALTKKVVLKKDTDDKQGHIYLVRCQNFFKIGITQDMDQRMADFTTSNPHPITLLKTWSYTPWTLVRKIERMLHQHYAPHHHRGEWFCLPEVAVETLLNTNQLIRNHCSAGLKIELTLPAPEAKA